MSDVLLINPPSAFTAYQGTKVTAYVQRYPILSIACLAATLREAKFSVSLLDLGIEPDPVRALDEALQQRPRIVGVSATTPLYFEALEISRRAKEKLGEKVLTVIGGPHASALPEDTLKESTYDIVAVGEGDRTIVDIAEGRKLADIKGICYRENGHIRHTAPRGRIEDLDALPFPALDLFDIRRYKCSRLVSRQSPMSDIMTSRGCVFDCSFCGKTVFGRRFITKSPERVIEEIKRILSLGYRELRFLDDMFTTDINRAKTICEMIIREGLKFPWNLAAGLRVDRVDMEFFQIAKRAGLYTVAFGFESGDQACLDSISKGITLEQGERAMAMAKKVGLETVGYFMLGLPAETEESMQRTIDFAVRMMPDFAKVTVTMPLPDARLFWEYEKKGLIKSRDWTQYKIHGGGDVYTHPNLSHEIMQKYYDRFYSRFYLNPRYLLRRTMIALRRGTFFIEGYYGLKTFFPGVFRW
jgi:anaerobic magnesium-protoporphyrin IX monomethyl ester cyclase